MAQSPRSGFLVRWLSLVSVALLSLLLMMGVVQAAPAGATAAEDGPAGEAQQGREGEEKAEGEDSEPEFEETVVVTASRAEQNLLEAPASVSVIDASDIEKSGAGNFGELLRQVPGVNVVQFGARDVQLTGRAATNSLATGSLVMVDGRSIYLDFFGFVMWDFVPTDFNELDQVEVVRGPGSSVWGANAFNGVVNIRTKIPQEMEGTSLTVGAGEYASRKFNLVYAGATENKDLGWKISASYYEQDAFERKPRTLENGGVITPLPDDGTEQPKLDFRLHRKLSEDSHWDLGIGAARTSGLVNTGIGPFDVDDSSGFYYTRFEYQRRQLKLTGYVNMLDGNATNLLSFDATTFQPLAFDFDTNTIDVAVQNGHLFGAKNRLVYGGNVRYAEHDLSIAPLADTRTEIGAFIEDEIRFTDHFHLFLGARIDDVEDVNTVFSPRVSVVMPVNQNNSFRISANQAFRAPSMTNLFLDTAILQQVDLTGLGGPSSYIFPVTAVGNQDLEEETILALDAAYNRVWDGGHFEVAVYFNRSEDLIDFRPVDFYSSGNPPPGWPLDPAVLDFLASVGQPLPANFTYENIGEVDDLGAELSFSQVLTPKVKISGSYSFANDPRVKREDSLFAINIPAKHKFSGALSFGGRKSSGSLEASYTDEAFWTDVLDSRYYGTTSSYFLVNARWTRELNSTMALSVSAMNLLDEDTPRHIFGDNIGRLVSAELRFRF